MNYDVINKFSKREEEVLQMYLEIKNKNKIIYFF